MRKKNPLKYIHYLTFTSITLFISLIIILSVIYSIEYVNITGEIKPYDYQIVIPKISGIVKNKFFTDGELVKKGDLLVEIDSKEYNIKLSQSILEKENLENFIKYQNKKKALISKEIEISIQNKNNEIKDLKFQKGTKLSEEEFQKKLSLLNLEKPASKKQLLTIDFEIEKKNEALEKIKDNINSYQQKINESQVYSNINGIVFEDNENIIKGSYCEKGKKIQTILSNSEIYAQIKIPEKKIAKVDVGQDVILYITALPFTKYKVYKGKLISLKKTIISNENSFLLNKNNSYYYTGKVKIDDPYFKIKNNNEIKIKKLVFGMTLKGKIIVGRSNLIKKLLNLE